MSPKTTTGPALVRPVQKSPTGIQGLDEITGGGLPRGRPTLICGGPGCGKTILSMEFLINGARQFGEPGVFLSYLDGHFIRLGHAIDSIGAKRVVLDTIAHAWAEEWFAACEALPAT